MSHSRDFRFVIFILILTIQVSVSAQKQGEKIFLQQCASCHTIGRGVTIGPDLANVQDRRTKEWMVKFINSPQEVINSGDSVANALYKKFSIIMPNHQFNANEINSIVAYIKSNSPAGSGQTENLLAPSVNEASFSKLDIERGKDLFEGSTKLTNKGPACISCHNIDNPTIFNGGLLAKDLTTVYSRIGPAGIGGILKSPPFPAMINAFGASPLTDQEIEELTAFLNYTNSKGKLNATPLQSQFDLLLGIIVIGNILFIVFLLLWNRVKKNSVNIYHLS